MEVRWPIEPFVTIYLLVRLLSLGYDKRVTESTPGLVSQDGRFALAGRIWPAGIYLGMAGIQYVSARSSWGKFMDQ